VSEHAAAGGVCAERSQVQRDRAGSADTILAIDDPQDGDGGFGADAFGIAEEVLIEHEITDQQNARAGEPLNNRDEF
jgi:hypothetical protein